MKPLEEVLRATARALGERLDGVFADLAVLAEATTEILSGSGDSGPGGSGSGTPRGALESLRPVVERIVTGQGGLVESAGVSVTPGALSDAETWHQWWSLVGGKLLFVPHNLDPGSVNFYDYTEMTWFARPLTSGRPELTGPYIDFGGAFDMKVVTAARPVPGTRGTAAVAGADLSMDVIERAFLGSLGRREETVALITETGKVVASNSARFSPGTRYEAPGEGLRSVPVPAAELATPPWALVVDAG